MSMSLYWLPPPSHRNENYIGLKWELGRYFDPDYNGGSDCFHRLDKSDIPFLKGIAIASDDPQKRKDANNLIAAIEEYDWVELGTSY